MKGDCIALAAAIAAAIAACTEPEELEKTAALLVTVGDLLALQTVCCEA